MFTLNTFYKSKEWEKLIEVLKIKRINAKGQLICEVCGKPILKKYDCIAHHKVELTNSNVNDFSISLNEDNIQLIHFKCHNAIHRRFGQEGKRKVYLVYGSPCSGKTTWVKENASPNDLILDIDSIWQAITINDRYVKPDRLKSNVFKVRDCILDMIATRTGKWQDAYVIGGYALQTERQRVADRLGAELIFIDTDKQTCLERAALRGNEWIEYVNTWFEEYRE